ncbi:MAG: sodium:proline symporter, partial [Pseudomonadota bacterium]
FIALILVPVIAFFAIGGMSGAETSIVEARVPAGTEAGTQFFSLWPESMTLLGFISLMAWGLGYFGQPHIIVRFMAIRSLKDVAVARWIGMSWMFVTVVGAVLVGYVGVAYVQQNGLQANLSDPETIFILLSQTLFHPLVSGFLLAAILAAIMSTISSQLLVSSSSLTEDLYKTFLRRDASQSELVLIGRIATIIVCLVAIALAFDRSSNILSLVSNAWAGFGAAFGPVILLSLSWGKMTRDGALIGMIVGAGTVLLWLYAPITIDGKNLSGVIYEIVPGFIMGGVSAVLVSLLGRQVKTDVARGYEEMRDVMIKAAN